MARGNTDCMATARTAGTSAQINENPDVRPDDTRRSMRVRKPVFWKDDYFVSFLYL